MHSDDVTKFTAVCTLHTCLPFLMLLEFVLVSPNHAYSLNLFPKRIVQNMLTVICSKTLQFLQVFIEDHLTKR